MKVAVFAALFQAVAISLSSAYPITGTTVNCRSGPGTHYPVKKTYAKGSDVKVICQTTGTSIKGNNIWDKTQDGCYVTDYYVKTGINGFVTTKCPSGGSSTASIPGSVTDDYPYKGKCGGVDPWNYYKCRKSLPLKCEDNDNHKDNHSQRPSRQSAPLSSRGALTSASASTSTTNTRASTGATPTRGTMRHARRA